MTLNEIKERVMFQTNNDADDLGDFEPHIGDYINDGYDRLVVIWAYQHVPSTDYPALAVDADEPKTPEWTHRYLADWATWLIYRNGNPQKQSRGMAYRASFLDCLAKISDGGGKAGVNADGAQVKYSNFRNIPY